MALSAALKARLQRLYLDAATPYAALVAESGLTRFAFQSLVRVENWGKRPAPAKKPKAVPETGAAGDDNAAGAGAGEDAAGNDDAVEDEEIRTKGLRTKGLGLNLSCWLQRVAANASL